MLNHIVVMGRLTRDPELRRAEKIHISLAEEKLRFFYPKGLTW